MVFLASSQRRGAGDEEACGAFGGGLVPGGCGLGTLFEAENVAGSGGRNHGRLQGGIGEMRSGRALTAPTRLSEPRNRTKTDQ